MKNYYSSTIRNIITSGLVDPHDIDSVRKVKLLNIISITGVIFLIPLGIIAYVQGNVQLGVFDHLAAVILVLNLFCLRINLFVKMER